MKNSSNVFLNVSQSNIQTDQVDYLSDGEWWFFGQLLSTLTWWRSWLRRPGDDDGDLNNDNVDHNYIMIMMMMMMMMIKLVAMMMILT